MSATHEIADLLATLRQRGVPEADVQKLMRLAQRRATPAQAAAARRNGRKGGRKPRVSTGSETHSPSVLLAIEATSKLIDADLAAQEANLAARRTASETLSADVPPCDANLPIEDERSEAEAYWRDHVEAEQARRATYPVTFSTDEELARLHDLVSGRWPKFEREIDEALACGLAEPVVLVKLSDNVESVGVVERVEALKLATTLRAVHWKGLQQPTPEGWFSVLVIGDGASVVYARQRGRSSSSTMRGS